MEFSSIVSTEKQNLTNELRKELIATGIPIAHEKDPNYCITIFAIQDPPSKGNSKKHHSKATHFQFCCDLQFDRAKIAGSLCDLRLLWQILKPECYQPSLNKISSWCRSFLTVTTHLCEKYDLNLCMIPFEVFFDLSDNLYVSKLPEFTDLMFYQKCGNSYKSVDATEFLAQRATSILEVNKALELMKPFTNSSI